MEVIRCEIPGLLILKPTVFKDERGSFCETYNLEIRQEIIRQLDNRQLDIRQIDIRQKSKNLKSNNLISKNLTSNNLISELFVQENQSISAKGVLRGLHFQKAPFEQGKLIRVAKGAVRDVVVDIRKELGQGLGLGQNSPRPNPNTNPNYGKYLSIVLSEENGLMLWVPPGFAHGFLTLENNTIFLYKCTQVYNKESEGALLWNDPDLKIDWGLEASNYELIISDKDKKAGRFRDL